MGLSTFSKEHHCHREKSYAMLQLSLWSGVIRPEATQAQIVYRIDLYGCFILFVCQNLFRSFQNTSQSREEKRRSFDYQCNKKNSKIKCNHTYV